MKKLLALIAFTFALRQTPAFAGNSNNCHASDSDTCLQQNADAELSAGNQGKANEYFRTLCSRDNAKACMQTGAYYNQQKNYKDAGIYYTKACKLKDGESCVRLGYNAASKQNLGDAKEFFGRACEFGAEAGCVRRAYLVYDKDKEAGKALLASSCDEGKFYSCHYLAELEKKEHKDDDATTHFDRGCKGKVGSSCVEHARYLAKIGKKSEALAELEAGEKLMQAQCPNGDRSECTGVKSVPGIRKEIEQSWSPAGTADLLQTADKEAAAKDNDHARTHYREACEKSHDLDVCLKYSTFEFNTGNLGVALRLDRWLCDNKKAIACRRVAVSEKKNKNYANSEKLFKQACDLGDGFSCAVLGYTALAAKQKAEARSYFERGCTLDDGSACFQQGDELFLAGDKEHALPLWQKACTSGTKIACARVATLNYHSNGNPEAKATLASLCAEPFYRACVNLGDIDHAEGRDAEAREHFGKACDNQTGLGCFGLGILDFQAGHKEQAKPELTKGLTLLKQACENYDYLACEELSVAVARLKSLEAAKTQEPQQL